MFNFFIIGWLIIGFSGYLMALRLLGKITILDIIASLGASIYGILSVIYLIVAIKYKNSIQKPLYRKIRK